MEDYGLIYIEKNPSIAGLPFKSDWRQIWSLPQSIKKDINLSPPIFHSPQIGKSYNFKDTSSSEVEQKQFGEKKIE